MHACQRAFYEPMPPQRHLAKNPAFVEPTACLRVGVMLLLAHCMLHVGPTAAHWSQPFSNRRVYPSQVFKAGDRDAMGRAISSVLNTQF